ncbi:unnamed protein product [Diatraea saccharalis]|uniref:EGF-like domain-containing protein n=1 Tax=Diatraea saccharalis TaxID=40085 RepID=A0A9N9RA39_9NEOP|nr:unnamed protein product [Diatraea saccharalis]
MDNSVNQFKKYKEYNDNKKIKLEVENQDNRVDIDGDNYVKSDDGKLMKLDRDDVACECQHGGGCVGNVCLCPLGYAGDKCEITLDLKVGLYFIVSNKLTTAFSGISSF